MAATVLQAPEGGVGTHETVRVRSGSFSYPAPRTAHWLNSRENGILTF